MGLLGDFVKRQWERGDREDLQAQVQGLIGQAPSPQFKQMSEQGIPVEEYVASKRPMDVRAGTGALESGQLDVQKLAQGLIGVPETQGIGAQFLRDIEGGKRDVEKLKAATGTKTAKEAFEQEQKIRGEFRGETKTFIDINDAYGRIQASSVDPSPAGDLSMIFNYMKMLDPGSVVRESEFATAEGAASVPERLKGAYNKVISGRKLTPQQRADFVNRAGKLYNEALTGFGKRKTTFEKLAESYSLDPAKATFTRGLYDPYVAPKGLIGQAEQPQAPALPPGFVRDK